MFHALLEMIQHHDTIIIHRHNRPDGDALGSQIGMKHLLQENFPHKQIHIVGDGVLGNQLTQLVAQYGLEGTVFLHGYASNPYPYIAAADWYLCTSLDEAYPLSVGEALLLGTPVMGTDCSGVREWLGTNEYGMVLPNSTNGIYTGMKTALEMTAPEYEVWQIKGATKARQIRFDAQLSSWCQDMLEA